MVSLITDQVFFNKTIRHFVEQGEQASPNCGGCFYRYTTPTGKVLKCAIGVHIPDAEYQHEMEGHSVTPLLTDFPKLKAYVTNTTLAKSLQAVHDNAHNWRHPADMVLALKAIAEDWGLSTKVLDSLDFSKIKTQNNF